MKRFLLPAVISSLTFLYSCDSNADSGPGGDSATETDIATNQYLLTKTSIGLSPTQEVPANSSPARGMADISYNKESHMLYFTLSWKELTGPPIMAHIHGTARKGTNANVRQDLSKLLTTSTVGSFTDSMKIDNNTIQEDSLLAGLYYFNIHTPAHPGGEIRGQIEF